MAATDESQAKPVKSDFMAAEEIKEILQGREKAEQERIIRWASESLGLTAANAPPSPNGVHSQASSPSLAAVASAEKNLSGTPKNIKAFVEEKNPKSAVHFVTVVAYFHRFDAMERRETIFPNDVQEAARLSGRQRFKKPIIPLNNAVTLGYLDRVEKSTFKINAVGENLVAMTLPGSAGEGTGSRKPKKKNARRMS